MTLSPVFRSPEAVEALKERGYLDALEPALRMQRESVQRVRELLPDVISAEYVGEPDEPSDPIRFVQEHFFLTLFNSLFSVLDSADERLRAYALLNVCIKGLVTSGDNLFDREAKMDLPLKLGEGPCFGSIVQMLCFIHIVDRILDEHCPFFQKAERIEFKRSLLSRMTHIGTLEGSEEAGVDEAPDVQSMVDRVHRVRGGELFALAFVAPAIAERDGNSAQWAKAEQGVRRLGTAFQIVDDVTDFEFDLGRRSHNIVAAQVVYGGTADEQAELKRLRQDGAQPPAGVLEERFSVSAGAVLELARYEAEIGFTIWRKLGFWFPPEDAKIFVRAIAGDAGHGRVREVSERMKI